LAQAEGLRGRARGARKKSSLGAAASMPSRPARKVEAGYGSVKLGAGGTLPKPVTYGQDKVKLAQNRNQRNILVYTPVAVYCFFLYIFMYYSFFRFTQLLVFMTCCIAAFGAVLLKVSSQGPFRLGSVACIFAVACGSLAGWYIHEQRIQFWYGYRYGSRYGNVVPSELASSHADASVIGFEKEAYVDTSMAVGYSPLGAWDQDFCVAPITSPEFKGDIQYFAAGTNCCCTNNRACRASFWCDGTGKDGMHSGVVIFDAGMFKSKNDHFHDAIRMATAVHDLVASKDAIIVRWVMNEDVQHTIDQSVREGRYMAAIAILFGAMVLVGGGDLGARSIYEEAYQ